MDASQILQIVIGVGTGLVGVFVGKGVEKAKTKKVEAETDSIAVSSAERVVSIWGDLNERLSGELENLRQQISEIKSENLKLHKENNELKIQVGILTQEVKRLTARSK